MDRMTVAKALLIDEQRRILVLRRSGTDTHRPGALDFPGGAVDEGEDVTAGVVREIREESGLEVSNEALRLLYAATEPYPEKSVTRLLFAVSVPSGEVRLSFEHDAFYWMPIEEVVIKYPASFYATGLQYALKHQLLPL